ncbi:hypothetical protein WA158_004048 [Blastocystis sp. Blastoise]
MDTESIVTIVVVVVIVLIIVGIILGSIKVVKHSTVMIVERFGSYNRTLRPGIWVIWPIIENTRKVNWRYAESNWGEMKQRHIVTDRIDMREHIIDFGEQSVITRDNVLIKIDALVYFRITDPRAATFNVNNLPDAIELLTQLPYIQLDAERWGVSITRVEIQNIIPPDDIKTVMESQIRSERFRRAEVLKADGGRMNDVIKSRAEVAQVLLNAEGYRFSTITMAQGNATSKLLLAEAEKKSIDLLADALKDSGVCVTDYMVAQQYIQSLGALLNNKNSCDVYLLPSDSIRTVGELIHKTQVVA